VVRCQIGCKAARKDELAATGESRARRSCTDLPAQDFQAIDLSQRAAVPMGNKVTDGRRQRRGNDLIVIESAEAATAFKRAFEARFASGEALSLVGLPSRP